MRVDSCPPLNLPKGKVSKLYMDVIFGGCAINEKCRSHQKDPESI